MRIELTDYQAVMLRHALQERERLMREENAPTLANWQEWEQELLAHCNEAAAIIEAAIRTTCPPEGNADTV